MKRLKDLKLDFEILSAVNAPNRHPLVSWQVNID